MKTDDRRACPIFRIERGTFQESNTRIFTFDYPSLNEEESVILRVTKLSLPGNSSAVLSTNNHQSHKSKSSSKIQYSDSYNDAGQVLNETKTKTNRARKHSLSDDYVFL
ncbi:unnamed protein product [Rotaria magnacalcarata]|nr:unnamed protein product [Rotaria magnacalcarata]CAF3913405.1 unnamed protein product [Rotaria magnacalcarata]CAF4089852.1 unnamed protein product [Rotaria magnacalcarata]CAF4128100.1 unnamed protein product [Rotaria magnacalcarata]